LTPINLTHQLDQLPKTPPLPLPCQNRELLLMARASFAACEGALAVSWPSACSLASACSLPSTRSLASVRWLRTCSMRTSSMRASPCLALLLPRQLLRVHRSHTHTGSHTDTDTNTRARTGRRGRTWQRARAHDQQRARAHDQYHASCRRVPPSPPRTSGSTCSST